MEELKPNETCCKCGGDSSWHKHYGCHKLQQFLRAFADYLDEREQNEQRSK